MTPTHTRRRGRLYRYYVSTSVIKAAESTCPICRIPAAEIEAAVITQIRAVVQSPEIIVATWKAAKQSTKASRNEPCETNCKTSTNYGPDFSGRANTHHALACRKNRHLTLGGGHNLADLWAGDLDGRSRDRSNLRYRGGIMRATSRSSITVHVPLSFSVRGGRKTIRIEPPLTPYADTRVNEPITRALAKAYRWRGLIEGGEYTSITELAKAKKVNQSYACRLLRLTLLAPSVIEDVLNGRLGSHVALKDI